MTREEALQQARELRDAYRKAILVITNSAQSYKIANQEKVNANLEALQKGMREQDAIIASLEGGQRRFRMVVPMDD